MHSYYTMKKTRRSIPCLVLPLHSPLQSAFKMGDAGASQPPPPLPVAGFKPPITPDTNPKAYHSTRTRVTLIVSLSVHLKLHRPPMFLSSSCLVQVKGKSRSVCY